LPAGTPTHNKAQLISPELMVLLYGSTFQAARTDTQPTVGACPEALRGLGRTAKTLAGSLNLCTWYAKNQVT
jgi:hypothetical protein